MSETKSYPQLSQDPVPNHSQHKTFWLWALCLTGVDYFSTLGYQPSIAYAATGNLCPLATVVVVLVTLFGAYPVYRYVAEKSPYGLGSIGMLEKLLKGWWSKIVVITLLGFAATDFVITKTMSAADATAHLIANPSWPSARLEATMGEIKSGADGHPDWNGLNEESQKGNLERTAEIEVAKRNQGQQIGITLFLLMLLGGMFLRGFKEVIGLAVVIVAVFLVLNVILIGSCLGYLVENPQPFLDWWAKVVSPEGRAAWFVTEWQLEKAVPWVTTPGLGSVATVCLVLFPALALGLSGFETGVAIMPLISGGKNPDELKGRIRHTGFLLLTAGLIMSVLLMGSSICVTTLIPSHDLVNSFGEIFPAKAKDRALAYLAHGESPLVGLGEGHFLFGSTFGTIYDISTIAILWFAGASAMSALLNLVPMYLPRYGMAPEWARAVKPLVILFTLINVLVTFLFRANVQAQGDAYATGVIMLILSAATASSIEYYRSSTRTGFARIPWYFIGVGLVFLYTGIAIVFEKPVGIQIASCFILAIFIASFTSRFMRSTELRFAGFEFKDENSEFLFNSIKALEIPIIVPHRPGQRDLETKEEIIRKDHRIPSDVNILFVEVVRGDPSEFMVRPVVEVIYGSNRYVLKITRCASIANVLAALALDLANYNKPPEIHFGWSDDNSLKATLGFLLFGEGNVPWLVHELIRKAQPEIALQPRVVVG